MKHAGLIVVIGSGLAACGSSTRAPEPVALRGTPPPSAAPASADVTPEPEEHWRELLGGPLDSGCVAVDRAGEALCITERGGLQEGTTFELAWLSQTGAEVWEGADVPSLAFAPAQLDADTQARAVARLVRGEFGAMPLPTWRASVPEGKAGVATIDDTTAPVRITWTRTAAEHVDAGDGQWEKYHDVVRSERPVACALGDGDIENPERSDLAAWRLPAGAILVERDTAWGIEGDHGGDTVAQMLVPGQPCPH